MNDQLPPDLVALGWKLLRQQSDGRWFAVSISWGGTVPSETIEDVIRNARYMTRYIKWRMSKEI